MALIQANFVSRCLMRTVPVQVILPVDCHPMHDEKKEIKPFKTLYLLHGIFGNYTDWVSNTRIQQWAEEKNLAVVMPAGDNAFYVDQPDSGNLYGQFIGRELVEITRRMFPLSHRREDTFIGGLSMGGYGALHNGLKYHKTFSRIAVLSGALHVLDKKFSGPVGKALTCLGDLEVAVASDKNPKVQLELLKKEKERDPSVTFPEIYLTCGREDSLYEVNCRYRDLLKTYDVDLCWESLPGDHDWAFWDETIAHVLRWLPLDD